MVVMRRRERARAAEEDSALTALEKIDAASDTALNEINQTSQIALNEINEKYQAMLFLYNLLDEKKKEIAVLTEPRPAAPVANRVLPQKTPPEQKQTRKASQRKEKNTRYEHVMELHNGGLTVPEIAKKLNIGQGEVQLFIDLESIK
jgi:DNA-binding NarL/FixJ family response regulator